MDKEDPKADKSETGERGRVSGVLSTLYHEKQQEMELLHKQVHVKDNIIADLKARLGKYERVYMTVGESDPVVIGPSNSLVESLLKEIYKLNQKRNDAEFQATRQAEEIQRLNAQLKDKELELQRVRSQPGHEKDQEIAGLRATLAEKERTEATRSVLCSSLAEEAGHLRSQLGATVKVCQEMLGRLEEKKIQSEREGPAGERNEQQNTEESPELSDSSAAKSQLRRLQEENRQLKQRVAYVQGLNTQWQKYDSSREDYIRGLCQRLKESGPGLMPLLSPVGSGMLQQEISRLNSLLENKMRACARLEMDVEKMQREKVERVQTLEQQVLIYAEDFKSERADRERAQGQIENLKEQISHLKLQIHKQQGTNRDNRDVVPLCRVHIGHRISSRRTKDSPDQLSRVAPERTQQSVAPAAASSGAAAAAAAAAAAWSETPGLSDLQCPRCLARFNDTEAAEYLNHCEECARL